MEIYLSQGFISTVVGSDDDSVLLIPRRRVDVFSHTIGAGLDLGVVPPVEGVDEVVLVRVGEVRVQHDIEAVDRHLGALEDGRHVALQAAPLALIGGKGRRPRRGWGR